jgi:hypothetical protein
MKTKSSSTAATLRHVEANQRAVHHGKGAMGPGARVSREPPPRLPAAQAVRAWAGKKK